MSGPTEDVMSDSLLDDVVGKSKGKLDRNIALN